MKEKPEKANPWKRQRILKKEDIPPQEIIYQLANSFETPHETALFILAYLTAGRISEIVQCPFLRKNKYAFKSFLDEDGHKKKKIVRNEHNTPKILSYKKTPHNYPGILKKNIVITEIKEKKIMIVSIQNRKNKRFLRKRLPIPIEKEWDLIQLLVNYLSTLAPEEQLFPFGVSKAERIIGKVDMNPHFLRDIRLTHLVTIYNFNAFQLTKFAGWNDIKPAERYVRLGIADLVSNY